MTKLYLLFLAAIFGNILISNAQGPTIGWQKCFGGSGNDSAYSIASGPAGGVVAAGSSASNDGDVTGHHGATGVIDAWVVALRYDGQLLWEKSYGGSGADKFTRITPTTDGGYIAIGSTTSTDGDVAGLHGAGSGNTDIWVVKLDGSGNIEWQKCLGGSAQDLPGSILQTADGGYVLAGTTGSTDGDVSGNHGGNDVWVVRLDKNGNLVWQQCYGNAGGDNGYDIQPVGTGKYALSVGGQGGGGGSYGLINGGSPPNAFIFLIDSLGNLLNVAWAGGSNYSFYGVLPVNNDLLYTLKVGPGQTCLQNPTNQTTIWQYDSTLQYPLNVGPPTGFSYCYPFDYNVSWGYTITGSGAMALLNNGTGVAAGATDDTASHLNPHGGVDGFLCNFGPGSWIRCYGGPGSDYFSGITVKDQFTYVAAGYTNSNSEDVGGNHGGYDFWVVQVGNYNAIKGSAFLDYNKNGVRDSGEPLLNNILVQSTKGSNSSGSLTNNGIFDNLVDTGTYSTSVSTAIPNYAVTPASHASVFSSYDNTDSMSFAFQPIPGRRDYAVSVYDVGFPRPVDSITYRISYLNLGTDTLQNRVVQFILDPRATAISTSVTPQSISGDTMRWNVVSLSPRDTGYISVVVKLAGPPYLSFLDTLVVSASIDTTGDLNTQNNVFVLKDVVRSSLDPNGKTEANAGRITAQDLASGKYLEYKVYFQNTGNDTAFTVTVQDVLSSKLDMTTLQMVGASAPYILTTRGETLTWTFSQIRLPESSQDGPGSEGYLVYRVKPAASVVPGDSIKNSAAIYFDYNLPVPTNTQTTYVASVILLPVAPQIGGLQAGYCNNDGGQSVSIVNMPAAGSGVAVTAWLDAQALAVSNAGGILFQPVGLVPGTHVLAVIFTNLAGADTTRASFRIDSVVTPTVSLSSNPAVLNGGMQQVVLTAVNVSGGGSMPLFTFAKDAGFTDVIQAESGSNMVTIAASAMTESSNIFYVRMRTSDSCYTAQTATDSLVLSLSSDSSVMPGGAVVAEPNPFSGQLTISGLDPTKSYGVSLVSSIGQVVLSEMVQGQRQFVLKTGNLGRAIYFLRVYDAQTGRVVASKALLKVE